MLTCRLDSTKGKPLTVLCLGAHSDDIEIGCGGTILKLIEDHEDIILNWIVFSSGKRRGREAEESACAFLKGAKQKTVVVQNFPDGFFPYNGRAIKNYFERLKRKIAPDVIFTHYRSDLHQDHRVICELTWNTFRDHFILEYEIVKYDGDLGSPNMFVHLSEEICSRKTKLLIHNFKSQRSHHWFTEETFRSILRLRGIESNAREQYAEAFYGRKFVIG